MYSMTFKIRGLDCAEEVATLQRAVSPVVGGEAHLAFDLLNGTMTVRLAEAAVSEVAVRQAVARTGMQALPWHEASATPGAETVWQRHGRTTLCIASGLLLASGLLWHALRHGSVLDALAAGDSGSHAFPLVSILLYLGAVVSGAWFIVPKALYEGCPCRGTVCRAPARPVVNVTVVYDRRQVVTSGLLTLCVEISHAD